MAGLARDHSDVLALAVPFLSVRSAGRVARVSRLLRAEVDFSWKLYAHDQGVRELPRGFTSWRSLVRENFAKRTAHNENLLDEDVFEDAAGSYATVGVFEAKFAQYLLVTSDAFPRNVTAQRSTTYSPEGYPIHAPPFSVTLTVTKKGVAREVGAAGGRYGASHVVLPRVVEMARIDEAGQTDWSKAKRAVVRLPGLPEMRPSPDSGIIQDCLRSELAAFGFSAKALARASHVVAVHHAVESDFGLRDDEHTDAPPVDPGSLEVHDAERELGYDEDDGHMQLWYGDKLLCATGRLPRAYHSVDTRAQRITIQRLVDSDPRDTAGARLAARDELERERALRAQREDKLRDALAWHGLGEDYLDSARCQRYIADGAVRAVRAQRSAAHVAREEATHVYWDEYCPALVAAVQGKARAVQLELDQFEAGLREMYAQMVEKDYRRSFDASDDEMAARLEDYVRDHVCIDNDELGASPREIWLKLSGVGSRDAYKEHLGRTWFARMPRRWPWLEPPDSD